MSEEELLSQDEIDVLLNGVDEGDVETDEVEPTPASTAGVQRYDLTGQDHIVRGRMPTLEMINERFTRYTENSMFNLLRQTPQVRAAKIESIKLSEYLQMLGIPTSLNMVKIHPLRGTALFVLDADLVVNLVDRFYGGGCHDNDISEREFTIIEKRFVQKILNQIFVDMKEAWKTVMKINFEYVGTKDNPSMVRVLSSSEIVVLSSFDVKISGKGGKIQIAIPYSMLEPVRETLDSGMQADVDDSYDSWMESLQDGLRYASVPISCRVAERKVVLREILNFKAGDVIPIEMPESSTLTVNGMPVFEAVIGASNDHLALKIKRQLRQSSKSD